MTKEIVSLPFRDHHENFDAFDVLIFSRDDDPVKQKAESNKDLESWKRELEFVLCKMRTKLLDLDKKKIERLMAFGNKSCQPS